MIDGKAEVALAAAKVGNDQFALGGQMGLNIPHLLKESADLTELLPLFVVDPSVGGTYPKLYAIRRLSQVYILSKSFKSAQNRGWRS